jgi:TonB family protein
MFVKYFLSITCAALITLSSSAQTITTYFTNKGKQVYTLDSADYTRKSRKIDTSTTLYSVVEYYKSGNIKCKGTSSKPTYNMWEGAYTAFYPSGNKKTEANYIANSPAGEFREYYPNGLLCNTKQYIRKNAPLNKNSIGNLGFQTLIINYNDSTGKPLLTNGNGHYVGYTDDYKRSFEQGEVKEGERVGRWTGSMDGKDSIKFEEDYDNGKLIKGSSWVGTDKVYTYTNREKPPEYEGGERAFSMLLRDNIRYPKLAKENNIQGRVFITFVVEKDGTLTDIKAARAPSADLAEESMRVLKLSSKWIPGLQYGRPVRVQYTVPINFSLR